MEEFDLTRLFLQSTKDSAFQFVKVTGIRPMALSKMEVHSTIYDSKLLNPNPNSPDLQPNIPRVICKMPFFRKAKIVQKRKEQVTYFFRATSGRQSGLFEYQIPLKAYRMPYHLLKSKNILKAFN